MAAEQYSTAVFNAEQTQRQEESLRAVNLISRSAGREIPIIANAETITPEPGVYILDSSLCEKGKMADVNFKLEPRMLSGAANSAHAVIAGELSVDYDNRSIQPSSTEVAAKCYRKRSPQERFERVQREVTISRAMADRGELALEPVAVAIAPPGITDGSTVLLTKFDRNLFTLDNHPWGRGLTPENVDMATVAAAAVGRFNVLGYHHKDSKIKNVAGRWDGKTGMIDFETSVPIQPTNPMEAAGAAHGDLGMLVDSLADKKLFTPTAATSYERAQELAQSVRRICDSYLSNWEDAPSATQLAVFEAVSDVAQTVIDRHSIIPIAA